MTVRSVVILCPESPYPMQGGGAFRTASILHYFSRFADVDLILFSQTGQPAELPAGLVRSQTIVRLPPHSRGALARWKRNALRAARGVPPLIDRLAGHGKEIGEALRGKRYDLGIIEHSWCAPYLPWLAAACDRTLLDMHNVESVLHERSAGVSGALMAAGHRRFAAAMRRVEFGLAPQYSLVAASSEPDAELIRAVAPGSNVFVYPNALPARAVVQAPSEENVIVFSGNFEYHPNIDAVKWLAREIWPAIRHRHPSLRLRLVGRGPEFVRRFVRHDPSIEVTGPVEDALPEIGRSLLVLAPLRVGSGTRLKILEAWQMARPVIATRLAAEGLEAREGENLLYAESAPAFAAAVTRLIDNASLRHGLGSAGCRTFDSTYTWEAAWRCLDPHFR